MNEKDQTTTPPPAAATTPTSARGLTMYRVLEPQDEGEGTEYVTYKVAVTSIRARTPDAAIEEAQDRAPKLKDAPGLVAVPDSAWHVFTRTTSFKREK